jgi:hypothetical protein
MLARKKKLEDLVLQLNRMNNMLGDTKGDITSVQVI